MTYVLTFLAGVVLGVILIFKSKPVIEKIISFLNSIKNKIPTFNIRNIEVVSEDSTDEHVGTRPPKPPKD